MFPGPGAPSAPLPRVDGATFNEDEGGQGSRIIVLIMLHSRRADARSKREHGGKTWWRQAEREKRETGY